jgi:hypothetical protein
MTQWETVWAVVVGVGVFNILDALITYAYTKYIDVQQRRKFKKVMVKLEEAFKQQDELQAAKKLRKKAVAKKAVAKKKTR